MAETLAMSKGSDSSCIRQMIVIGSFFFIFGFITWSMALQYYAG